MHNIRHGRAVRSRRTDERAVLQSATGPTVYLTLAIEIILLVVLLAGSWIVLQRITPMMLANRVPADAIQKQTDGDISSEPGDIAFAIAVNVVAMILCLSLLLQTDGKKQAGWCRSACPRLSGHSPRAESRRSSRACGIGSHPHRRHHRLRARFRFAGGLANRRSYGRCVWQPR